ncbi:hypothetical protein Anas_05625 [Armadillidium nasatum]|uniref:Major facilitator superfamily (MFS) profile domain-containing protein n=1 Tax=Armadillidium nasatum TaxID=96803 RepID=A0A5N5SP79_9CRUS|nr:hypothetical protein Anas_05625 [Armadillidium nasatum]
MASGFGTILMPFGKSLTYLMSMTGFYTFGSASFHSYANAILSETFSKENEATTWGLFRLTQGLFSFIHPVYLGYIVDQTGEFKVSFIVMGTIIILSGLSIFVEKFLHVFNRK